MRGRRLLGVVALGGLLTAAVAGCGDDGDEGSTTFGSIGPAATGDVTGTASPESAGGTGGADVGGYVRIQVRLGATGADEVLDLDRASVDVADLEPISLDARCTALDGGAGLVVSVVDLRRVAAGHRLVSASLRIDGDVAAGGTYQGTIDVGDTRQLVTTYAGTVTVDGGLAAGTFDMADANGQVATGSFACDAAAPPPVVSTTVATTSTTIPLATS